MRETLGLVLWLIGSAGLVAVCVRSYRRRIHWTWRMHARMAVLQCAAAVGQIMWQGWLIWPLMLVHAVAIACHVTLTYQRWVLDYDDERSPAS